MKNFIDNGLMEICIKANIPVKQAFFYLVGFIADGDFCFFFNIANSCFRTLS